MFEKYNVTSVGTPGSGGQYPVQWGFGYLFVSFCPFFLSFFLPLSFEWSKEGNIRSTIVRAREFLYFFLFVFFWMGNVKKSAVSLIPGLLFFFPYYYFSFVFFFFFFSFFSFRFFDLERWTNGVILDLFVKYGNQLTSINCP
jgi:hypothetical protein